VDQALRLVGREVDVLAGAVSAFVAQHLNALRAALLAGLVRLLTGVLLALLLAALCARLAALTAGLIRCASFLLGDSVGRMPQAIRVLRFRIARAVLCHHASFAVRGRPDLALCLLRRGLLLAALLRLMLIGRLSGPI
jgi:hypothetical protein